MTSHVFGLSDADFTLLVEQVLREVPLYPGSIEGYQETDQVFVELAIHHYFYPIANIVIQRFSESGYVPFYQINEIVSNVLLRVFQHSHPNSPCHAAIWNNCITKQYHTTVYC